MKKIMFSDRYGLTDAVLAGRKTMTRRIITLSPSSYFPSYPARQFNMGEVVAVAQSYKSVHIEMMNGDYGTSQYDAFRCAMVAGSAGWNNKMFVRAELMPHHIRILKCRVERMQAISDDDVYREGFSREYINDGSGTAAHHAEAVLVYYDNHGSTKSIRSPYPREAFACLIDKLSGYGTFESNPLVYAYSFSLVD